MNQLQAMRVFTRVVDLASFSLAAKQLGMSAAAVTRSISMLEAHLNMRLLNRSTRRLSLTEAGQAYVEGCRTIIQQLDTIEEGLVRSTRDLSGTLRVAASTTYAACGLSNLLAAYRAAYPRIGFDVTTYDSPIELIEGGFDVGFSADRNLPNSSLVCRHLTAFKEVAVASPGYLSQHGTPVNPAALAHHHLLSISDGSARNWEFSDQNGVYRVATGNALHATSSATVRSAALADMGIALLPVPLVKDDLGKGLLLPILGQFQIAGGVRQVSILYTGRNYLAAKVRHFIDFSVSQYRAPDNTVGLRAAA
ncbi:LysR family transcriptional regulator [Caballeronia sp. LjRoot29]|uniref:LysR family transcriptional regulator n=1 Tax=unclassified Caballeronia TaxID=2646786 RepID=UPI0039E2EA17